MLEEGGDGRHVLLADEGVQQRLPLVLALALQQQQPRAGGSQPRHHLHVAVEDSGQLQQALVAVDAELLQLVVHVVGGQQVELQEDEVAARGPLHDVVAQRLQELGWGPLQQGAVRPLRILPLRRHVQRWAAVGWGRETGQEG